MPRNIRLPSPRARIAVRVEATGAGGVRVDCGRIEPDLRALFRDQFDDLSELGG